MVDADREDMLRALVAHAVAVKEVRLIRDKFTGQPRGFGFMEFHSVSDAARALQMLQVKHPCSLQSYRCQTGKLYRGRALLSASS